jgi:ubiquinone/menaquinone biosynthesis C-methylase UbiE
MAERRGPDRLLFDIWSRFYDAPLVQRLTYRPEQDAVLRELRKAKPGRVLDIGCGTGLLAGRIGLELAGADVVGCDFSRGMLEKASANAPGASLARGSAIALPFQDQCFEAVLSTEAFHWFPDQPAALREFHRVLVPGGHLLVSLIHPHLESLSRAGDRMMRMIGEPAHWPTRHAMHRQVEKAGFRVVSQRFVLRLPATLVLPSFLTVAVRPI